MGPLKGPHGDERKQNVDRLSITATASDISVRNRKRTSAVRPEYEEERLRAIRHIALILRESLTPRGVGQF